MGFGGLGLETFGPGLMGAGGPISVLGARAIAGQTVRVALSGEPMHVSAAGLNDALNPSNYIFAVTAGDAEQPLPVGVAATVVQGPILAVPSGAWGVDVYTDRPLVAGISFTVTLSPTIQAKTGGVMGSPYTAPFYGVVRVAVSKPPQRKVDLTDVRNDVFEGTFGVDDSGDLGLQGGHPGLAKRMLRRAYTPKNAFAHLPGYGTGIRLKESMSPAEMAEYKNELEGQLKLEPEVQDASVQMTQLAVGVVQVLMTVRTKSGALVEAGASAPQGVLVVP